MYTHIQIYIYTVNGCSNYKTKDDDCNRRLWFNRRLSYNHLLLIIFCAKCLLVDYELEDYSGQKKMRNVNVTTHEQGNNINNTKCDMIC